MASSVPGVHVSSSSPISPVPPALRDRPDLTSVPSTSSSARQLWQSTSRKLNVIQHASSSRGRPHWTHRTGREPGLDPRRASAAFDDDERDHLLDGGPAEDVRTDVVDFSADRIEMRRSVDAKELKRLVDADRPKWAKVRWININGCSWSILRKLGLKYDLHPLALEDAVHAGNSRSKVDYYRQHLFVKLMMHELIPRRADEQQAPDPDTSTSGSAHSRTMFKPTKKPSDDLEQFRRFERSTDATDNLDGPGGEDEVTAFAQAEDAQSYVSGHRATRQSIDEMTKAYKVQLAVQQVSVFLLKDGTIVTTFQHDSDTSLAPLFERLREEESILRTSEDASMLLQGLLDVVVDNLLEIAEAFRRQLTLLEARVLVQPEMEAVRHLHILAGELLLLKRTLTPIQTLMNTMRYHDAERTTVVSAPPHTHAGLPPPSPRSEHSPSHGPWPMQSSPSFAASTGYLSPQAKIYFGDVLDHLDGVLSSLDLFSNLANNLVSFSFNTLAFSQNESVRGLSIITVIFLPLTFLSGYFGDFVSFPPIQGDIAYFWQICIPVVVASLVIFGFDYFRSIYRTGKRKTKHWRILRAFKARRKVAKRV